MKREGRETSTEEREAEAQCGQGRLLEPLDLNPNPSSATSGLFLHLMYFIFQIIFDWSCYYSCPSFSPFSSSTQHPPTPSGHPPTIVHVHGSWVGSLSTPFPVVSFTSPWLFRDYLFVLLNSPHFFFSFLGSYFFSIMIYIRYYSVLVSDVQQNG